MPTIIKLIGVIGWDIWAEEIVMQIESASGDLEVEIASEGGYVSDGILIFNALRAYDKGNVKIVMTGYCMSIASYIAMAGDSITAYDNAIFMIHNAWSGAGGDHHALRKYADHLEAVSALLANKYAEKTGISMNEIVSMMDEETYFYGKEITERGFADGTLQSEGESNRGLALEKATERFRELSQKVAPRVSDDAQKACAILKGSGYMKQFENKPLNISQEENVDELLKRLKALEAKSQRTDDEAAELAKVRAQIDEMRQKESEEKDAELAKLRNEKAELQRKSDIAAIAKKYNASEELAKKFDEKGTPDEFVRAILDDQVSGNGGAIASVHVEQNNGQMLMAMADGLALRAGANIENPHKDANMFRHAPLLAVARKLTGASEFEPAAQIAQKVLAMGTSDFPVLLSNVANKVLEDAWEEEPTTYQEWCGEEDVADFKTNTFVHLGGFGNLQNLYEKGELKRGTVKESSETGKIGSKGLIVPLSRESIINDDLGAFTRLVHSLTQSGRRTLNADVYSVLTGTSYKMSDSKAVFHDDHNNLADSGTAITDAALTAGELAMSSQTGLNSEKLNLSPYFLITGPAKYREGKQILSNVSVPGSTNNAGIVNTWQGDLSQIKDGNISGNQWYLAARNNTVKVLHLAGTGRRPIIEMSSMSLAGVEYIIVFDYGVMVANYRTLYKNAGA